MNKDIELLNKAYHYWESGSTFRLRRRRFKSFAYGRQWTDTLRTSTGRIISEEQQMIERGRMPITNNLIRRLIKNIVGRYRYNYQTEHSDQLSDIDARGLEEFLISGCVIQRLNTDKTGIEVINVSPERMLWNRILLSDGTDCRFIGMLHDMSIPEILRRFSGGSISKSKAIKESYSRHSSQGILNESESLEIAFSESSDSDKQRVIEIWDNEPYEILRCHDYQTADYYLLPHTEENHTALRRENKRRSNTEEATISYKLDIVDRWRCTWFTPDGEILSRHYASENETPPFVMKFYPLIDGEVHSLVEDIIDQQKYVNRLITLLDDIISSSAKGVLLFPTEQLPDGFSWRDIRRIWSDPNGIIPYRRTSKHVSPRQLSSSGNSPGATEMLKLQMQLFDEISGNSTTINGRSSAQGAEMLRTELEIENISMLDIFCSYRDFIKHRNMKIKQLKSKTDNNVSPLNPTE